MRMRRIHQDAMEDWRLHVVFMTTTKYLWTCNAMERKCSKKECAMQGTKRQVMSALQVEFSMYEMFAMKK
jgi:hypothetical protein